MDGKTERRVKRTGTGSHKFVSWRLKLLLEARIRVRRVIVSKGQGPRWTWGGREGLGYP